MRPFLIFVAAAALPALVAAHWNHFLSAKQGPLLARVLAALDDPMFTAVRKDGSIINYLDISLAGRVANPTAREEARRRVGAIPGVRCREMDNHLFINPAIHAELEGEFLKLSGWLRDEGALRAVTRWLKESRPGLEVDTADIQLSPHTARVETPGSAGDLVPPELAAAWRAIRLRPSLKIERANGSLRVSGALPSAKLRDAVLAAALGARTDDAVDTSGLRAGPSVVSAPFTHESLLPEFLHSFFSPPGDSSFDADARGIRLHSHATPELEREWNMLLAKLAHDGPVTMELRVLASVYHLPGYRPESRLSPDALQTLRAALATTSVHFGYAVHSVSQEELPRMVAAAQAILAAGPGARIIVGAHLDWVGEPRLNDDSARRRVEAVMGELKSRGVPAAQLEPAVFSVAPGPDGGDQGRSVELLVK